MYFLLLQRLFYLVHWCIEELHVMYENEHKTIKINENLLYYIVI